MPISHNSPEPESHGSRGPAAPALGLQQTPGHLSALERLRIARGMGSTPSKGTPSGQSSHQRELAEKKKLPYYQEAAIVLGADGSPAGFVDGIPSPSAPAHVEPPPPPTTAEPVIPDARTAADDLPPSTRAAKSDLVVILEDGEVRMPPAQRARPNPEPLHTLSPQTLQPEPAPVQSRRDGMSWDVTEDHAVIIRTRRITGPPYASVASTVAFMIQELYKDLGRLGRGHDYEFKVEIWRSPEKQPETTPKV